ARPYAVVAARRFSRCALVLVITLALSGTGMAVTNVGTVAGLVGTTYGRLLLAKVVLLVPILALAAVNRSVHLPRLSGDGATVGRPAMRRLARFVLVEGALALAIDAYPTTYLRPAVPYQAASIATGAALYRTNCVVCHGTTGAGDGPGGARLPQRPADLRASHTAQHTAGDLFWWISHGIPRAE